jgi:steroid delta-isomerase-like uncharacterized protein
MSVQTQQALSNTRGDGAFRFLGLPTLVRATGETSNGAFGIIESWSMPPGFSSPYHTHHLEDESFYVLEGEVAFVCDCKWLTAGAGTYVFGPRQIPHGFKVVGNVPARMLLLCSPAGFENFVLEQATDIASPAAPPDMEKMMALAAKYQIDIHGPLPEQPGTSVSGEIGERDSEAAGQVRGDNKGLNLRWLQAFNERDWETEAAVRTADFRAFLSGFPEPLDSNGWSGFMTAFTAAFPDARIAVDGCVSEGDTVVTRWTLTGTHQGTFQGIPATGHAVKFTGIEYNRVVGGRIAEHWSMFDNVAMLQQIGAARA